MAQVQSTGASDLDQPAYKMGPQVPFPSGLVSNDAGSCLAWKIPVCTGRGETGMDLKCPIHGPSFPGGSDSKAYAYNVGDLGSIPVTHANFYSNNHLSLNISITLRRGPPNVPMQVFRYPREKKRKLQQNMIKLAKIKSKAVSVLKERTHYNFLVKTK